MAKRVDLDGFLDEVTQILEDFEKQTFETRQEAVQAGAEELVRILAADSPSDTGAYKNSWKVKEKIYPDHRYVGNTATARTAVRRKTKSGKPGEKREGVPLSNVLEYSETGRHYGRIRRCVRANRDAVAKAMKKAFKT